MLKFVQRPLNLPLPGWRRSPQWSAFVAAVLLAGALVACAGQKKNDKAKSTADPKPAVARSSNDEMPPCASKTPGTTVILRDIPGGVAVDFVNPGKVDLVRRQVRDRLTWRKSHPAKLPIKLTKTAQDIPKGVRILVKTSDPASVNRLRAMVRKKFPEAKVDTAQPRAASRKSAAPQAK